MKTQCLQARNIFSKFTARSNRLVNKRPNISIQFPVSFFFLSKHIFPGIYTAVSILTMRVKFPTDLDMEKLRIFFRYLNGTKHMAITLQATENIELINSVDVSFAVHEGAKSHTGPQYRWDGVPFRRRATSSTCLLNFLPKLNSSESSM